MGLSEKYKQRIKESMDLDEGGKLHAIADKASAVNAPVLIIGLGGTGMDSLLKTKKLIYDTIQAEDLGEGEYSDKPKNIEYVGFDTDERYKNKAFQGIRLNEQNNEVNVVLMPHVQPVIKFPEKLPPYINKWLDTGIQNESVTAGAGAVRQLGRLLLMENIGTITNILQEKIKKVTNGYPADVPLYIFILAGISGGTGSGTFIDIPYLVRAISMRNNSMRPVKNIGILFMPDANATKKGVTEVVKHGIYANGFAALKELDYLMNIEKVGDSFTQSFGSLGVGRNSAGSAIPPYDICLLMSSKDKSGMVMGNGNENYDFLTTVVAETVFNFVLGDDGKADYHDFSIESWLSNEKKNISTYQTMMGDLRRPVSYHYSIAGASSAQLPLDDIMSYLTYKAFKQVQDLYYQDPSEQDIEEVESYFHLGRKTMENEAQEHLPRVNVGMISTRAIKENPASVSKLFELNLEKQKRAIVENVNKMQETLIQRLGAEDNIVNSYFLDMKKGPVYIQRCLYNTYLEHSVITDLRKMILDLSNDSYTADQMEDMNRESTRALTDVKNSLADITGSKLKKYLDAMQKEYNAKEKNILYSELLKFCQNASNILTKKNNEIFEVIADLLNQMMKIFENYGNIKTRTAIERNGTTTTLSWYMVKVPKFIEEIEKRIDVDPEFSVNMVQIVSNFYQHLLENTEKWRGENYDVVEDINSFIYRQFMNVLDNSMEFFLDIIASSEEKTLRQYCDDIIDSLIKNAEVHFPIDKAFAVQAVEPPKYSFVSVPSNCPTLLAAVKEKVSVGSIVKTSGIKDRIFMMNFESATPLNLNPDLKEFYECYNKHSKDQPGLHLYVPTKFDSETDWWNLPSPLPESECKDLTNPRDHAINEKYRAVFAKALEYGYVTEDKENRMFTCRYGSPVDIESILSENKIVLESSNLLKKDVEKAIKKLQESLENQERLDQFRTRNRLVSKNGGQTLDREYEEMMFIQMFRIRDKVAEMVKNHEDVIALIQKLSDKIGVFG